MASRKKTNSPPNTVSKSRTILQLCQGQLRDLSDPNLRSFELEEQIEVVACQVGISVWRMVEANTATFSDLRDLVEEGNRRVEELESKISSEKSSFVEVHVYELDATGDWG